MNRSLLIVLLLAGVIVCTGLLVFTSSKTAESGDPTVATATFGSGAAWSTAQRAAPAAALLAAPSSAGSSDGVYDEAGEHDDDDGDDDDESETSLALADVPEDVLQAAEAALPGARWEGALTELESGELVYELWGSDDVGPVEIELNVDGKVLEIERDDD